MQIEKDVNNNKYALIIPKANPSVHSGVITIKATNPIGSIQHELNINILGKNIILFLNKFIQQFKYFDFLKIYRN